MTPAPAPDQQPVEPQDPTALYGEHLENLPEQIVNALREQVKEFQGQEKYLRRREVMRDRRARFYDVGFQHIYWNNSQQPGYTMIAPGGTAVNAAGQMVQAPRFVDDYNLFHRYLQINMAILTQTSPGIDFKPNDASRSEDLEAAESAELYRHDFDRNNDVNAIRQNTVRMFGLSGRCIRWTRSETNAQKYGVDAEGNPRTVEISTVHGTLESKVSILARSQGDCLYVFLADDLDVKQAKAEYPWKAERIKAGISGLGENAYERLARLGVLQGARSEMLSADSFTHLVPRTNCWIRPEAFTGDHYDEPFEEAQPDDVDDEGLPLTLGGILHKLFPEGVHVRFVGDVYCEAEPQSIEDALCIEFPYEGDGMNRPGFMEPFLVVQDGFNDDMNAAREVFDVGWPSTWLNADDQEYDAIVHQRAEPFAIRQLKNVPAGTRATDMFFREPNPELPASFVEFIQQLSGELPQFMLAAPPAIFGAAMEDQKTASGYAQARAQAMGQQGLIFAKLQQMDATMYYQAAICASKNPDETRTILVPGAAGQTASLQVGKLTKGNFKAYPAGDSNMPESTAAKRATIDQVLTLLAPTPLFMQITAVPKNMRIFLDTHGLEEICIPEAEAYDKQMFEIEELLQQAPIPADPAMQQQALVDHAAAAIKVHNSGMNEPVPPPPVIPDQPSVPVNDWDRHQWEAEACQDWLNSEACRRQLANGNTQGVQNVVLHWKQHVAQAAAQMPPPMPMGPVSPKQPILPPKPAGGPLQPASISPPGSPGMATM